MTHLRVRALALALVPLLMLAACAGGDDVPVARDTGTADQQPARPDRVPAADGLVHTPGLATVMDTGSPELCLGPVAESYPPQCGGPPIEGWDWDAVQGVFEQQGSTRWGTFHVTGRWDGTTFSVTDAIPAALYDTVAPTPEPTPTPAEEYTEAELLEIQDTLTDLPGYLSSYPQGGQLVVDVLHDDGSIQAWADAEYGTDVFLVGSALEPLED